MRIIKTSLWTDMVFVYLDFFKPETDHKVNQIFKMINPQCHVKKNLFHRSQFIYKI